MSIPPLNISRVSTALFSASSLSNIQRTNVSLFDVTNQLSTGRQVNRPSDDPVRAAAITLLDNRRLAAQQRGRSIEHASGVLDRLDSSLSEASDLVRQAQSLASSQIGLTSDANTRRQQAEVVNSQLRQLFSLVNRTNDGSSRGVYLFGGATSDTPPVIEQNGGYRYVGRGSATYTDLGLAEQIPITLGGSNALGELSSRVRSQRDLDPDLWIGTALSDVSGARGLGVAPGIINFQFSGSPAVGSVDLTDAKTIGDVVTKVTASIRAYETANSVTVLGPGGVSVSGEAIYIDVVAAGSPQLTFSDPTNGTTAADLGLVGTSYTSLVNTGQDVAPGLSWQTPLSALNGVTIPPGSIRIRSFTAGVPSIKDIDLSTATTLGDVRSIIETAAPGTRVEINDAKNGINFFNEIAGVSIAIEEVPGGTNTATEFGIRSLGLNTSIADFNNGRGVRIVDSVVNPATGLVDPALNTDFRITLGNGQYFDVDLRPQDLTDVQTVLARINAQFTSAIGSQNNPSAPALAAGNFTASITNGINGLAFSSPIAGAVRTSSLNNSAAAEDLGLNNLTFDGASSAYVAQDKATVRVNNLFSDLIDLRDALLKDDQSGLTTAGENLSASGDRLFGAAALVGTYAQRVDQAKDQLADQDVLDEKTKSDLQYVDFAEAATRYSQLQTQLEASLRVSGTVGSRSLFDFLS